MKNKNIILGFSVVGLIVGAIVWTRPAMIKKSHHSTEGLPRATQEFVEGGSSEIAELGKDIRRASTKRADHQRWGEKVYRIAMVETEPKERIRLLRVAKEHLIYAKELGHQK